MRWWRHPRGTAHQVGPVKPAEGFAGNVRSGDGAGGDGEVAVSENIKAGLEPIQGRVGGVHVLSQHGLVVPTTVDGLGPQDVSWREIIRVEGHQQVGPIEWDIELDELLSGSVERFVPNGDVEFRVGADDVVEFQLDHAVISEVAKVEGDGGKHAVDHESSIEVVAHKSAIGHHQLPAFFDRDRRAGCHGHVGVDRQRTPVGHDHMAVEMAVIGPCFGAGDGGRSTIGGCLGCRKREAQQQEGEEKGCRECMGSHGAVLVAWRIRVLPGPQPNQRPRRPYSSPEGTEVHDRSNGGRCRERWTRTRPLLIAECLTQGWLAALCSGQRRDRTNRHESCF